jgi:hypothetical protein
MRRGGYGRRVDHNDSCTLGRRERRRHTWLRHEMTSEPEDELWAVDRPVMPSQSIWDANDVAIAAHHARLRRSPAYEGWFWNGTIALD